MYAIQLTCIERFRITGMFRVRLKISKINNSSKTNWKVNRLEKRQCRIKYISFEFAIRANTMISSASRSRWRVLLSSVRKERKSCLNHTHTIPTNIQIAILGKISSQKSRIIVSSSRVEKIRFCTISRRIQLCLMHMITDTMARCDWKCSRRLNLLMWQWKLSRNSIMHQSLQV